MKIRLLRAYLSLRTDRGATAVEYALIVALIAVVIIAGVTVLGTNINTIFDTTADKIIKP